MNKILIKDIIRKSMIYTSREIFQKCVRKDFYEIISDTVVREDWTVVSRAIWGFSFLTLSTLIGNSVENK